MKLKTILGVLAVSALFFSCNSKGGSSASTRNPLIDPDTAMYMHAPEFDKLKPAHFKEGFEKGFEQINAELEAIASNAEPATFANTIEALEKSGAILDRTSRTFFALAAADTNNELRKIEETYAPKLTEQADKKYLNDALFQRVKTVYENRDSLNDEQKQVVKLYYDNFVKAGAALPADKKQELMKLNTHETELATQFGNLLTDATNVLVLFEDKAMLDGLSQEEIDNAAALAQEEGESGYAIRLVNTTQQPVMASLNNRDARKKVFEASMNRCSNSDKYDTRALITELAQVRAKKAALLGFPNYAAWSMQNTLAKDPATATAFLSDLAKLLVPKATQDAAMLEEYARKTAGADFHLEAWDWAYYAEKMRKEQYNVDEATLSQYFELNNVLNKGVFFAANKLYGLSFEPRTDLPVYHKDVTVYDVKDETGQVIALFYFDPYARPSKSGGAWMDVFCEQSYLLNQKPVIYNVCNYKKPATKGEPCLLTWDDVTTLFHEFGHSLHGMLSRQTYPSIAGTNTPRDFVEMPSQFNEHWANEPSVFANYALHYQTGEPMPADLRAKMQEAASFNQAYSLGENIAASLLDLAWHSLAANAQVPDVDAFEQEQLQKAGIALAQIPPRYRSTYFRHIWSNGYGAGYYSYLWTEALDNDIYAWFQKNGGMTRENGKRLADVILSRGNSRDLMGAFTELTGHLTVDKEPLLKSRGLK